MNILIIGGGGREHAITWKVAQSDRVQQIWVAPGNAGTAQEPKTSNLDIPATAIDDLVNFAKSHAVNLTIVGPEAPLAAGIVDQFQKAKLAIFGPSQLATQLESSKRFCKDFLKQHGIPTAAYANFTDQEAALAYLNNQSYPIVIKADGLAAGKGVVIAETKAAAQAAVIAMLADKQFGSAGQSIVIEEFLNGEELSFIVMSDGQHCLPLASSQDHKRRDDGDLGPNTGGMGAYSPSPLANAQLEQQIMQQVIQPTIAAMAKAGTPYVGFLYAGLMITPQQEIKVLEFNCRMGDPETQPILMRLQSDVVELCELALQGQLDQATIQWDKRVALAVVLAAGGYPTSYQKGVAIDGLAQTTPTDCKIFHAGTALQNNQIVTNGGRVLAVTALGDDVATAQSKAYQLAKQITWPDYFYRHDIGHRALKKPI